MTSEPVPAPHASTSLEEQLRVLARQSMQDDERMPSPLPHLTQVATLNAQLSDLQTKLLRMPPAPADLADHNTALARLEARMGRQDAQMRTLALAVDNLATKVSEQNSQLALIIASRPDSQIAALRAELGDMGRWCERFNSAHHRTLARCAELEVKLKTANEEVARLRDAGRVSVTTREPDEEKVGVQAPVQRQVAVVQESTGRRNSGRKPPSTPVPANSPIAYATRS
ncbi:hypothetical protein CspeluHIS016_0101070 [Cutaneotrichosporon spelunceum]|uniref:Uncharacterized protein n=1 Tax=Cutaneotrichosporon spelunceum TaxID=1672016 RepID=A0AAD3TNE7_9TREE|nr:hypothetical protein CspeluHIS016_0101070 [Cutaneotrichosporon spelunceum]